MRTHYRTLVWTYRLESCPMQDEPEGGGCFQPFPTQDEPEGGGVSNRFQHKMSLKVNWAKGYKLLVNDDHLAEPGGDHGRRLSAGANANRLECMLRTQENVSSEQNGAECRE